MQFGFTLKPDHTIERTLALTRQAEDAGFTLRLALRLARPVAGPVPAPDPDGGRDRADAPGDVRDESGHARADRDRLGTRHARRDQRRAHGPRDRARRLGAPRARQAAHHARAHRGGHPGDPGARRGRADRLRRDRAPLPVDRRLDAAGVGRGLRPDGDRDDRAGRRRHHPPARPTPTSSAGSRGQVREAAVAAGRDPASISIQAAAPAHVGPRDLGRDRTRWFPALVSNHVVDLIAKYPRDQLPDALTGYIARPRGLRLPRTTPRSARRTRASSATR